MFIRRRRLLWLIVVAGSLWVVISTYFVGGTDDSNTRLTRKHSHHIVQSINRNSIRINTARSARLTPSKEFYDYDEKDEVVIDSSLDKSTLRPSTRFRSYHEFKVVTSVASNRGKNEIKHQDSDVEDRFRIKADVWTLGTTPKPSILKWRRERTPVQELPLREQTKKRLTPILDGTGTNAKHVPGKLSACLLSLNSYQIKYNMSLVMLL